MKGKPTPEVGNIHDGRHNTMTDQAILDLQRKMKRDAMRQQGEL